jgi:hypothetical protein
MLKARMAERFLSLVTTRERANSIVGDFEETGSRRLLFSVVQTFLAMLSRDIATNLGRLTGTAGLGLVAAVFATFASVIALIMAIAAVMGLAWAAGLEVMLPGWLLPAGAFLIFLAVAYAIGRWMARECPGHELAVCVTFVLLHCLLELAVLLIIGDRLYVANVAFGFIFDGPMFAGAIRVRTT